MAKDDSHEWGKLNLGQNFQVLALDVFRALACAGLDEYEWIIMQHVIEQSWFTSLRARGSKSDYPNAVLCKLNLSVLARCLLGKCDGPKEVHVTRTLLSRAKKSLVNRRFLADCDGEFLPIKNVDAWMNKKCDGPAISDGRRKYAASIQTRRNGVAPATHKLHGGCNPGVAGGATPELQGVQPRSSRGCYPGVAGGATPELHPPIEERAGNSDLIQTSEDSGKIFEVVNADASELAKPTQDPEQERINKMIGVAEELAPLEGASSKIGGFVAGYGIEWVEAAVLTAMASPPRNVWQYINGCLLRWRKSGGPTPSEFAMARDAQAMVAAATGTNGRAFAPAPRLTPTEQRRQAFRAGIEVMKRKQLEIQGEAASGNG